MCRFIRSIRCFKSGKYFVNKFAMSDIPNRACRVGGRRLRKTERQNPYYRPHNRPLQSESCSRQPIIDSRQQRANEWSRGELSEDALCPSLGQERNRSYNDRHSLDTQRTHLKSPSHLRNCYLPKSRTDFRVCRSDISQDIFRQRSAEMAHSRGHRIQSARIKVQEHKIDRQNLELEQQQACSEIDPLIRRQWGDMVEEEELAAEMQNYEFDAEHNRMCPEQVKDEFEDISVERCSSSHVRQNSFGSDSTTESIKIKMSATPRFTESELDTKEVQAIIARRKKQIQYGKVLDCYHRYIQVVPRNKRTKYHPRTPDIYRNYSRRGFDTLVRTWKKQLHAWEPVDNCRRSMKLGSTCGSSITTDTSEAMETCRTLKEIKEDINDYDSEFPAMPASATVKTEGSSELPSVGSSTIVKAEGGGDDKPACGVVVKTEILDDSFSDESCN